MVARAPHVHRRAGDELLVHPGAATAALLLAQDTDPVAAALGGVAAQRVLPDEVGAEHQVDVRARGPGGQRLPGRVPQGQQHHAVGGVLPVGDHEVEVGLGGQVGVHGFSSWTGSVASRFIGRRPPRAGRAGGPA